MAFLITYIYINRYSSYITKYSPKLLPKINSQSEFPKLRYRNVIEAYFVHSKVHNYFRKLFTKLFPKILPEICSPKLPEAAPEQFSTTPKLVPNTIPKNIFLNKLPQIITQNSLEIRIRKLLFSK